MQVGSIVKCVKVSGYIIDPMVTIPKVNSIYIVRDLYISENPNFEVGVYLEEIINDINCFGVEPSFEAKCFVELLPPEECSIEELFEEVKEKELEI